MRLCPTYPRKLFPPTSQVPPANTHDTIRGKFFEWSNKDHEISSAEVESKSAGANGGEVGVASCGRSDASSGTEGSFDVYDGDTHVCHIYWDCPWGSKHNKFEITNINDDYGASYDGASLDSGAIGTVTVKIGKYA